jgi:hypothetical protein
VLIWLVVGRYNCEQRFDAAMSHKGQNGKDPREHISSSSPSRADIATMDQHFGFGPSSDVSKCSATANVRAQVDGKRIKPKQTVRQDFRQCLIIAPRSSTCRVQLHWRLGQGADHGRMARVAEAWDRSTAPGATPRSTISSASVRLQRLRLACRSGARLIPILATRHGRARPGHACLWTDILNPL